MARDDWFAPRWRLLKRFGLAALAGVAVVIVGLAFERPVIGVLGVLLVVPLIFWLAFVPVLH